MRVTHIITRLVVGGAQENTVSTVLGLRGKPGVDVKLISGPTTGPEGSMESRVNEFPGLLTIVPSLVRPVHPLKDCVALNHLTKLLREQKPDIVHSHSGKAGILGRIAAARAQVPVIIHHIHGPSFGPFQGRFANKVFTAAERYAAKHTTHFFCSADAMTQLYLAAGIAKPENYTRIFSGFDVEPFANATCDLQLRDQLGIPRDAFVIGKIARIFPLKGHEDLLLVLKRVLSDCPNAHLLFVGDGSLRSYIENRICELGVTKHVTFTGLVPPSEVPRYVGIMDCLAHLSTREALSRALPQALAAGKPVVSYDFDGANEICLDGETGFLVKQGHENAAAERLLLLARDPALRTALGQRGQRFVRDSFEVREMVEKIYAQYETLLARQKCQDVAL